MAALQVELADKGLHDLSQLGAARHFREVASAAQHFALTDKQHMHAGHAGIEGDADHVEVVTGVGDKLFLRHAADGLNLVADARRLFELRVLARLSIRAMSWVSTGHPCRRETAAHTLPAEHTLLR